MRPIKLHDHKWNSIISNYMRILIMRRRDGKFMIGFHEVGNNIPIILSDGERFVPYRGDGVTFSMVMSELKNEAH